MDVIIPRYQWVSACVALMVTAGSSFAQITNSPPIEAPVFSLGTTYVYGRPENTEPAGLLEERITPRDIQRKEALDLSQALDVLPGVTTSNNGPRNDAGVFIRGFDLRQVPLFVDGIPVYVPYDGYVDLRRFTTFDVAEISVSKGYSSVIYGPNALGGAINVVSRRPQRPFEMDALAGGFSGGGKEFSLNIGGKQDKWYYQAGVSLLDQDHYRVSDDFHPLTAAENGGVRENSYRRDWKASFKIGYTPNETDEYAIGYLNQQGNKGTPPYAGTSPAIPVRFWQWPEWNKQTVYYVSNTRLGADSYLKPSIFFDKFDNILKSYDDATYTKQTKPFAFTSIYDDYTWGSAVEFGTELVPRNLIKTAFHYKLDHHTEHNVGASFYTFEDQTFDFGLEDTVKITDELSVVPGISYEFRDVLQAVDTNTGTPLGGKTFDSLNPEIAAIYLLPWNASLHASVAHKSRFPTIKDRYSYRLGTAIPNPNLQPETATHYEIGYSGTLVTNLTLRTSFFYSQLNDTIQAVNNVLPGLFQLQNVGRSENIGTEVGMDYRLSDVLLTGASYTYLDRKNISRPDIHLTDVPKHKIYAYTDVTPVKWLTITPSLEYDSGRFSTSTGTMAGAFFLANLEVTFHVAKGLSASVGVNNLLDRNYALTEGFPEAGRNYFFNLRYSY